MVIADHNALERLGDQMFQRIDKVGAEFSEFRFSKLIFLILEFLDFSRFYKK